MSILAMNITKQIPDVGNYLEDGAGDCELRSIAFAHPNVFLSLYDPYYERLFYISLYDVNFIYFYSNHVQNVIGRIYCFKNFEEANRVETFAKLAKQLIMTREDCNILEEFPVIYFEPITGGDLIAQYRTMTITDKFT